MLLLFSISYWECLIYFYNDFVYYFLLVMKIKNILFDFGGVVIDVKQTPISYIEEVYYLDQWFIYNKIKDIVINFSKWLIKSFEFRKLLVDRLWQKIWEHLYERWSHRENVFINAEIILLIDRLKSKWYNCYLLSDTNEIHKSSNFMRHAYDVFDELILSCDIWLCKREDTINWTTKFFDYAIKKLNINPEESIFIDDLVENCNVAQKLWIKTIVAKSSSQIVRDLSGILGID